MATLRINTSTFLKIILALLILFMVGLMLLYYWLSRPPMEVVKGSEKFQHLRSIYGYGPAEEEQLKRPSDVAFDTQGNMYIADTGNGRILVFNQGGGFIRKIGSRGVGRGQLRSPLGIAVDRRNKIYVADQALSKLVVYSSDGKVEQEIRVMSPLKPVIKKDKLYLTNYAHVLIYNLRDREELAQWGRKGKNRGEFESPVGLAVDNGGGVYVSDLNNLRIQAFDNRGQIRWLVGALSAVGSDLMTENRRFGLPAGLAVDEQGLLYLVDAFNHHVEVLTKSGRRLTTVSGEGQKEGQLYFPQGIGYWKDSIFAVADKYNDRVQLVRITVRPK